MEAVEEKQGSQTSIPSQEAAMFLAHIAWSASQRVTKMTGRKKAIDFWNRIMPRTLRRAGSMDSLREVVQYLVRKMRCRHILTVDHGDGLTIGLPHLIGDLNSMSPSQEEAILNQIRNFPDILTIETAEIVRGIRDIKEQGEEA